MQDGVLKAITADGALRAVIASTTHLSETARKRHNLSYTATAALGRALTGGLLLASTIERTGRVSLQFQGNGPLGTVRVDASAHGTVRGYVQNPKVELPPNCRDNLDVGSAIGRLGYLHVTVDHGFGRIHTSSVELASGEVGEDLNRYLVNSDQTGSIVILGTHVSSRGVEAAGGLIVQLLPDHTDETICMLENNVTTFGGFTFLMRRGMDLQSMLTRILAGFEVRPLTEVRQARFLCPCNSDRFLQALQSFGQEELISMAFEDGQAEGRCQFCNEIYLVGKERLLELAQLS